MCLETLIEILAKTFTETLVKTFTETLKRLSDKSKRRYRKHHLTADEGVCVPSKSVKIPRKYIKKRLPTVVRQSLLDFLFLQGFVSADGDQVVGEGAIGEVNAVGGDGVDMHTA